MLVSDFTIGNKPHVNEWFKLNIWSRLECVQMELVRCRVAFATDFDHIVEVSFTVAFKLNIQFDS